MTWTILSNIIDFYHQSNRHIDLFSDISFSDSRIQQSQVDSAKLMIVKMCLWCISDQQWRFLLTYFRWFYRDEGKWWWRKNITAISSLLEQSQIQGCLVSDEEWEIIRIIDKRQRNELWIQGVLKENVATRMRVRKSTGIAAEVWVQTSDAARTKTRKKNACRQ
jgi:hypothetical protein